MLISVIFFWVSVTLEILLGVDVKEIIPPSHKIWSTPPQIPQIHQMLIDQDLRCHRLSYVRIVVANTSIFS